MQARGVDMWQYKVVSSYKIEEEYLNILGSQGWDLVCSYTDKHYGFNYLVFKQEKK